MKSRRTVNRCRGVKPADGIVQPLRGAFLLFCVQAAFLLAVQPKPGSCTAINEAFAQGSYASPEKVVRPEEFEGDASKRIQSAINSLQGGGIVLLQAGKVYRLTRTVYYKSNVTLLGERSIIDFSEIPEPSIAFDRPEGNVSNVEFNGITFTRGDTVPDDYVGRSTQGRSIAIKGYFPGAARDFRIMGCSFLDIFGRGIFLVGVSDLKIVGNNFKDLIDAVGLGASGNARNYSSKTIRDLQVLNNTFYNCSTGIVFQGLSDVKIGHYEPAGTIEHCEAIGNTFCRVSQILIEFYACCDTGVASYNVAEDCPGAALIAKLSKSISISFNRVPFILVQGNNTDPGDFDFKLENVRITNNVVHGEVGRNPGSIGIEVWRQASEVYILNNDISDCRCGISIGMTRNETRKYPAEVQRGVCLEQNSMHDNTHCGLSVNGVSACVILDNHIYDNGIQGRDVGIGVIFSNVISESVIGKNVIENRQDSGHRKQFIGMAALSASFELTNFRDNVVRNNVKVNSDVPINSVRQ